MIKMKKKAHKNILINFLYCLQLSLQISISSTLSRFVSRINIAVIPLGTTWCTKYLLDLLAQPGIQADYLVKKIAMGVVVYSVLSVLSILMQKWNTYITAIHTDQLNHVLEERMMERAVQAELSMFDEPKYYDRYENARRNAYVMGTAVWNMIDMCSTAVSFLGACGILATLQPFLAVLYAAVSIPAVFHDYRYTRRLYDLECENVDNGRKRNYLYQLATERWYAQELRLFQIGSGILARYERLWREFFTEKKKLQKNHTWKNMLLSLPPELCTAAVLGFTAWKIIHGESTVGDFSLYLGAVSQLVSSTYIMISSLAAIRENQLRIENVRSFLEEPEEPCREGRRILAGPASICFSHVSFRYPGTDRLVLEDVSFTIAPGERVALVGTNGSGKSTVIKLMLRFYDVTEGQILYNGIPIQEYNRDSIWKSFSVLFQDFASYAFTVRENIRIRETLGKDTQELDTDRQQAWRDVRYEKALQHSGMKEILGKLPRGDETYASRVFEENGEEFSKGQYQKLALARALYQDADMVLLDEPSAALDPRAEYEIFQAMDRYCRGKTLLFITHRLDHVGFADRILYLENGKLLEEGTEQELLNKNGSYARLRKYGSCFRSSSERNEKNTGLEEGS